MENKINLGILEENKYKSISISVEVARELKKLGYKSYNQAIESLFNIKKDSNLKSIVNSNSLELEELKVKFEKLIKLNNLNLY